MNRLVLSIASALILVACSDDGGGGPGGDGGSDAAVPVLTDECREGGIAASGALLPVDVGNIWRYQVTEVGTGNPPYTKRQELTEEMTPDGATEPVIIQVTTKANGQTVNWLRRVGDAIVRIRQMDYDADGNLERTTDYLPYKLRLDETPDRLEAGALYNDEYTAVITDPNGLETSRTETIDQWLVVATDAPCATPWGTLSCVQIHRERMLGGVVSKDYFFAPGYGKVREDGGQIEELTDCSLQ